MKNLHLYEKLLLLAFKDKEGTLLINYVELILSGAIAASLIKDQFISVDEKKKVHSNSKHKPEDIFSNEFLTMIEASDKSRKLVDWVQKYANTKNLKHRVAQQLCNKGILKADEDKILFIFTRKIYPEINPEPEIEIMKHLEHAIFTSESEVDDEMMILIALADSIGLLNQLFGRKRLKDYRSRIKSIKNGELTSQATKEIMDAYNAAILVAAIMPAIIASTTVHT